MYTKNYLMRYECDVCRFAILLANKEYIEKSIKEYKEYELKLSEQTTHISIKRHDISSRLTRLEAKQVSGPSTPSIIETKINEINERYMKEIENFQNRDDINYEYKANVDIIHTIIDEFLDYYGKGTIYEVNIESNFFKFRNLESDDIYVYRECESDEDGEHYYGTYVSYSYLNSTNKKRYECDSNILLDEGIIVYDKTNLILITEKYDLILRVLKSEPKKEPKNEIFELFTLDDDEVF